MKTDLILRAGILAREHELALATERKVDTVGLNAVYTELKAVDEHTTISFKYLNLFREYLDTLHIRAIL
jgi:hypothetical protein